MWCVVHAKRKGEQNTESFVKNFLPKNLNARCFHLTRDRQKKYEGQWRTVQEDLFPGYVFIDTNQPDKVYKELKKVPYPQLLFSDEEFVSTLEKQESDFMELIADRNGVIKISEIRVADDGTIQYLSGPLLNVINRVKRMNLHKRVAELETRFLGKTRILYLGIEIEGRRG